MIKRPTIIGTVGAVSLLAVYLSVVSALSGWSATIDQWSSFWPYLVGLTIGFGVQVGLYVYLRQAVHRSQSTGKVVVLTGTTSTVAMVSCCTHYLVNLLPVLGATGIAAFVGQYQAQLFWVGLAANAVGLAYLASRIVKFKKRLPVMAA
ncbi:MAG: hypothetical protein HY421_00790 [Candidatus Kerfeldbacteria bacterium]|nr:hypothetical protein [Candidatus Kerfeldbacteria bacterium]